MAGVEERPQPRDVGDRADLLDFHLCFLSERRTGAFRARLGKPVIWPFNQGWNVSPQTHPTTMLFKNLLRAL